MELISKLNKSIAIFYILLQHSVSRNLSAKSEVVASRLMKNNGFKGVN